MLITGIKTRTPDFRFSVPWTRRRRPRGLPERRPLPVPPAPRPSPPILPRRLEPAWRPGAAAAPWRPAWAQSRMEGLDDLGELSGFLKKAFKSAGKAVKSVGKAVVTIHKKSLDLTKKALKSVGKFVKKNAKWIVIAAAIAITIYTMGGGAAVAAKLAAGYAKVKGMALSAGKAVMSGMQKLLGGKKMGELTPEEAQGLATANAEAGTELVPKEITSLLAQKAVDVGTNILTKKAMSLADDAVMGDQAAMEADGGTELAPDQSARAMQAAAQQAASPGGPGFTAGMPSWVIPAAIGGGALVLLLVLKK